MKRMVTSSTSTALVSQSSTSSENYGQPSSSRQHGRGRGRGGCRGCGGRNNYTRRSYGGHYYDAGRESGGRSSLPPLLPSPPSISAGSSCQICNKSGHTARVCSERGNFAYSADSLVPPFSALSVTSNDSWCVDSGATQHMTPSLQNLDQPQPYTSTSTITVGNGTSIPISHTGQSASSDLFLSTMFFTSLLSLVIYYLLKNSLMKINATSYLMNMVFVPRQANWQDSPQWS